MRRTTSRFGLIAAILALGCALAEPAFARGGRGGGAARAGAARPAGHPAAGARAGGYSGAPRGGGLRSSASTSINRGGSNRVAGGYQRPAGGVNRGQLAANRPAGGYDRGQLGANRPVGDRQYARTGDRINTGDRITRVGNNTNINIDNDHGWGGWYDHPVGAGLAIGATAAVTAAAIGSVMYSLPHGCAPYPYGGYSYYNCGGTYYESRYEGDTVVYVTVPPPG